MPDKSLNDCAQPEPTRQPSPDLNASRCDVSPQFQDCAGKTENTFYKDKTQIGIEADTTFDRYGLGEAVYCDPMLTGQIVDDPTAEPLAADKTVINTYRQGLRGADMATKNLFENIVVIDERGKVFPVPIIWGSQERAVDVIMQSNVRKDNTAVIDRLRLPMMSIYTSSYNFTSERYLYHEALNWKRHGRQIRNTANQLVGSAAGIPGWTIKEKTSRDTVLGVTRGLPVDLGYTLTIWTRYWEDMNQILTQVRKKFSPIAYIKVQGVTDYETIVKVEGVANNLDTEPGDKNIRVFKFVISLMTETFIPQSIVKRKAVLKTVVNYIDEITDEELETFVDTVEKALAGTNICLD